MPVGVELVTGGVVAAVLVVGLASWVVLAAGGLAVGWAPELPHAATAPETERKPTTVATSRVGKRIYVPQPDS